MWEQQKTQPGKYKRDENSNYLIKRMTSDDNDYLNNGYATNLVVSGSGTATSTSFNMSDAISFIN